jgi:hypothetical protein
VVGVRDHERAGRKVMAARFELPFGGGHCHVRVLEAERHECVLGRVIDDEDAAAAHDRARDPQIGGGERHRLIEDRLVVDPIGLEIPQHRDAPAGVARRHLQVAGGERGVRGTCPCSSRHGSSRSGSRSPACSRWHAVPT